MNFEVHLLHGLACQIMNNLEWSNHTHFSVSSLNYSYYNHTITDFYSHSFRQIFEIYESLPSPTLDKMNYVVRSAVNICTIVYISVGFLGYIAYCTGNFTGNVLLSFAPSLASELYKLGFVMSIAVSFPLVIFPCRASLYSLIFRRVS